MIDAGIVYEITMAVEQIHDIIQTTHGPRLERHTSRRTHNIRDLWQSLETMTNTEVCRYLTHEASLTNLCVIRHGRGDVAYLVRRLDDETIDRMNDAYADVDRRMGKTAALCAWAVFKAMQPYDAFGRLS